MMEYQKESRKLLHFCEKMVEKREKEIDSLELEQPEGVPKVKEISKEKLISHNMLSLLGRILYHPIIQDR